MSFLSFNIWAEKNASFIKKDIIKTFCLYTYNIKPPKTSIKLEISVTVTSILVVKKKKNLDQRFTGNVSLTKLTRKKLLASVRDAILDFHFYFSCNWKLNFK